MDSQKRQRCENWNQTEKEILRQIIAESAHIIENKSTKSQINEAKTNEWKNIKNKFNDITGKNMSYGQIKLAWKRMKLSAKANLSVHRQQQSRKCRVEKPPSSSEEDIKIMKIAHGSVIDTSHYNRDAVKFMSTNIVDSDTSTTSTISLKEPSVTSLGSMSGVTISRTQTKQDTSTKLSGNKRIKEEISKNNMDQTLMEKIVAGNIDFKKRHLEMLKVEHEYKIKISKLKLKKLDLEISLLENEKKVKL